MKLGRESRPLLGTPITGYIYMQFYLNHSQFILAFSWKAVGMIVLQRCLRIINLKTYKLYHSGL